MIYKKAVALTTVLFLFFVGICQQVYIIPKQTFNPYKILGFSEEGDKSNKDETNFKMKIDSFEISHQIIFKQYKEYLDAIKKDSSNSFYISQLPDSTITSRAKYKDYISNKKYDDFPVAGISWDAAINYCKWRTLQDNKGTHIKFIYRLPQLGEWLAAFNFLKDGNIKNDFSKNFSDWTMNTYYEGFGGQRDSLFVYERYIHLTKQSDHARDKRKIIIGNSYLFQGERLGQHFRTYYSFNGYRQIAFRMVKEKLNETADVWYLPKRIIAWWGIEMKK